MGDEDGNGNIDGLKSRYVESVRDEEYAGPRLRFTFDQIPKNKEAWVFGSNPQTCDILIGSSRGGTSNSHFRITFDDQKQLVLIDSSAHGTAVSYGNQGRDEKRNRSNDFTWILFPYITDTRIVIGHNINRLPKAPVVELLVEVANPELASKAEHLRLRDAFLDEMRMSIPFGLNIDTCPTTAGQTESHTPKHLPKQRTIWVDLEKIGSGAFGVVYKTIDVSTGLVYAAKTFMRDYKSDRKLWDKEVAILSKISHVRINLLQGRTNTNLSLASYREVREPRN